jgi:hypothetical protein
MVKEYGRVTFSTMLDMAPYASLTKIWYPYQLAPGISHPAIPRTIKVMTFFRIFGRRIRLNDTGVEAVEESTVFQDNFPETEEPSELPPSFFAWHPMK